MGVQPMDPRAAAMYPEWSKVFDLGDAALILIVKGNQLNFKLVHFTEKVLEDYLNLIHKGRVKMPEVNNLPKGGASSKRLFNERATNFMVTEETLRNKLRFIFEQCNSGKLIADGVIVPNLIVQKCTKNAESQVYSLSFITSANKIYMVELQAYFLLANHTVKVYGPFQLQLNGTARAFEKVDSLGTQPSGDSRFVIGTTVNQDHNAQESVLIFAQGNSTHGFQLSRISTTEQKYTPTSFIKTIGEGLKTKVRDLKDIVLQNGSKVGQQVGQQSISKGIVEDGVVCIKKLSNQLFAVLFTSGQLYIISTQTEKIVAFYDMLIEDQYGNQPDKILKAKLDFQKRPFNFDDSPIVLDLALAFQGQSTSTLQKTWSLTQLSLYIKVPQNVLPLFNQSNEDSLSLGDEKQGAFILNSTRPIDDKSEVIDILFEGDSSLEKSHLWLATYSKETKKSKIQDLKNPGFDGMWDREQESDLLSLGDDARVSNDIFNSRLPHHVRALSLFYANRITLKDRFRPQTLSTILNQNGGRRISNSQSVFEQLLEIADSSPEGHKSLFQILNECKRFEQSNSKVLGISKAMRNGQFRFCIRNVGVSAFKQDTLFKQIENTANNFCLSLAQSERELTSSYIRQLFPLNEAEDDNSLLFAVIGCIKFMHLNTFAKFDQLLLDSPDIPLQGLLHTLTLESIVSESLNYEVLRVLDANRSLLDAQLQHLIDHILTFLDSHSSCFTASDDSSLFLLQQQSFAGNLYTLPLLKFIERGLLQEVSAIYDTLRDLLLAKHFIEVNHSLIDNEEIENQVEKGQRSNMWLRQMAAMKEIVRTEITSETVRMGKKENVLSTMKMVEEQSGEAHTLMGYIIAKQYWKSISNKQRRSLSRAQADPSLMQNQASDYFESLLTDVLPQTTFSVAQDSGKYQNISFGIFPPLVRLSYSFQRWDLIMAYLWPLYASNLDKFNTFAIDFSLAFASAKLELNVQNFKRHFQNCVLIYKRAHLQNVNFADTILDQSKFKEIQERIEKECHQGGDEHRVINRDLKFYLALILQLSLGDVDLKYQMFIVLQALEDPKITTDNERDLIYEKLFSYAQLFYQQQAVAGELMYKAIVEIKNIQKKKHLIGQYVLSNAARELDTKFNQSEIDLAFEFLLNKIDSELPKDPNSEILSIESTLRVLVWLSDVYLRQVDIARSLWSFKLKLDRVIDQCRRENIQTYQSLLKLQLLVLTQLYIYGLTYGDHVLLVDDSHIEKPSSNNYQKRPRQSYAGLLGVGDHTNEEKIARRGLQSIVDESAGIDSKFLQGEIKRVGIEDIKAALVLSQARISASEYVISSEPSVIAEYLAEAKQYELAVEVCIAFKVSPAYPIALMIKDYHQIYFKEGEGEYQAGAAAEVEEESNLLMIDESAESQDNLVSNRAINQLREIQNEEQRRNLAKVQAYEQLSRILNTISIRDKLDIAKVLTSQMVEIPEIIEQQIAASGQVKSLLEFYLSNENFQLLKAVNLVVKNAGAVEQIADLDLQLIVYLMQIIDTGIDSNEEQLKYFKENEKVRIRDVSTIHKVKKIECDEDFARDLEDFFNADKRDIHNAIIAHRVEGQGFDQELDDIRKDIKITQEFIFKLQKGKDFIAQKVVSYLNRA